MPSEQLFDSGVFGRARTVSSFRSGFLRGGREVFFAFLFPGGGFSKGRFWKGILYNFCVFSQEVRGFLFLGGEILLLEEVFLRGEYLCEISHFFQCYSFFVLSIGVSDWAH